MDEYRSYRFGASGNADRSLDVPRQHLALADMVRGADDALGLHALDDPGGAVVADLQVPLHQARRRLALAADQRPRLVVETVARFRLLTFTDNVERRILILGDLVEIGGLPPAFQEGDHRLDLLVADEGAVHAGDPP